MVFIGIAILYDPGHELPDLRLLRTRSIRLRQDSLRYLVKESDIIVGKIRTYPADLLVGGIGTARKKSFCTQYGSAQQGGSPGRSHLFYS
ncbi:hypothetical protein ACQ86N_08620 [Puia sp. P3]|uniref:hypothetical protein n=1 Tax=Puia sp. P3 TaxID=3423952 RepID=UPI003D678DEB